MCRFALEEARQAAGPWLGQPQPGGAAQWQHRHPLAGTAGVPGVGLITLSMVLTQVNLPVEGIALIMGIDRLLDMSRTAINVTGDIIVTKLIAKFN